MTLNPDNIVPYSTLVPPQSGEDIVPFHRTALNNTFNQTLPFLGMAEPTSQWVKEYSDWLHQAFHMYSEEDIKEHKKKYSVD